MFLRNDSTIDITLIANRIDLVSVNQALPDSYHRHRYRDALYVSSDSLLCIVFDYGVAVFWSTEASEKQQFLELLQPYCSLMIDKPEWEQFTYKIAADAGVMVQADCVTVPDSEPLTFLAISHALAQSEILEQFESKAEKTVAENAYLSETLSTTGKIPLSRKQLAKLRGALFKTKSDILLHFSLLDTPEFFWEYPDLEPFYLSISKYLDLTPRVQILTLKLETIHELLEMLAAEQNHKHSAFLEWIIIILIAVDILVYFGK